MAKLSEMTRKEVITALVKLKALPTRSAARGTDIDGLRKMAIKAKKALKSGKSITSGKGARKAKAKPDKAKKAKPAQTFPAPIKEKLSRTQMVDQLVESLDEQGYDVDKKLVKAMIETLGDMMLGSVRKKGIGEFMFPGLFKIVTVKKPATKEREGINPFTKEPCVFKAKLATVKVKVRPMKKLKDAAVS